MLIINRKVSCFDVDANIVIVLVIFSMNRALEISECQTTWALCFVVKLFYLCSFIGHWVNLRTASL